MMIFGIGSLDKFSISYQLLEDITYLLLKCVAAINIVRVN